jgi:hypothetical protein
VEFEPGGRFESLGEKFAGVSLLLEISDQELGDGGVVIDEKEFDGIAGKDFHIKNLIIISITSIALSLPTPFPVVPAIERRRGRRVKGDPQLPFQARTDRVELAG